jgi:hypothetical protein
MEEHVIVDSSFAIINAPLEQIDIPSWCFSLPDDEYQDAGRRWIAEIAFSSIKSLDPCSTH